MSALTERIRDSISEEIRVPPRYIDVSLAGGSVHLTCKIQPPMGTPGGFVLEQLGTKEDIGTLLIAAAVAVPGIEAVSTGTMTAQVEEPSGTGLELLSRGLCQDENGTSRMWNLDIECRTFADCTSECEANYPWCNGMAFAMQPVVDDRGCKLTTDKGRCVLYIGQTHVNAAETKANKTYQDHACYVVPGSDAAKIPTMAPTVVPTERPTTAAPTAQPTPFIASGTSAKKDDGIDMTTLVIVGVSSFAVAVFLGVILGYCFCLRSRRRRAKVSPATALESLEDAACLLVPRYWKNRSPYKGFSSREEPPLDVMQKLAAMAVPGSEVIAMHRVEDRDLWRKYAKYRHEVKERRRSMCTSVKKAIGCELTAHMVGTSADPLLDTCINETYIFHGSNATKVGAGRLNLQALFDERDQERPEDDDLPYGPGLYLSDEAIIADKHGKEEDGGPNRGTVCLILCRVVLGEIKALPDDDKSRDEQRKRRAVARAQAVEETASHESVFGRQTGERQFVVFNQDAIYPEYIIYYKRPWWEGWDEWR